MSFWRYIITLVVSYMLGAIPFGLVFVWLLKGRDIRKVASGRTGGTNAMRAAGAAAGWLTAIFDVAKSAATVWVARQLVPGIAWVEVAAPLMAMLGHNYSIYLLDRGKDDRLRIGGGAGGAPCAGGALGLWPPAFLMILPLAGLVWYFVGYASLTTMSIALLATIVFAVRAALGHGPWIYALYGLLAELIVIWALRPNIKRLLRGEERLHGWRARKKAQAVK